jgi:hypothetical protein
MKKLSCLALFLLLAISFSANAGEPLVVKAGEGKYVPAVASEWAKTGEYTFRFMLQTGTKASQVAEEIKEQIAPISVSAPDDASLIFKGEGLEEQALLEKLSAIQLGQEAKDKDVKDALAALSSLGEDGGPALGDLSSAGSIRASKGFKLPDPAGRKKDPNNVIGEIIEIQAGTHMPTLVIRVIAPPEEGPGKPYFPEGKIVAIRGYFKLDEKTNQIDSNDKQTAINLLTKEFKEGDQIYGHPKVKDGQLWVLETIEKMQ